MHFRLSFEDPIHDELVTELEKGAAHATLHLKRFRMSPDRRSADIECADGTQAEVTQKVQKLVAAMVSTFRSLGEPEELARAERQDTGLVEPDAFAELERRKWVRPLGKGQVGFAGGAFALRRWLDEALRDLGRELFSAEEEDYPSLVDPDVLARSGYLGSFPHTVCLVSHLAEDFDAIETFRAANTDAASLRIPDAAALVHSDAALRPAVCLPIYRAREHTTLPPSGTTITTVGRAFRYESSNLEGIQRLWDFSMREIVFLASSALVADRYARVVRALTELMKVWDLGFRLVSASDPFFATVRGTKTLWQRSRALKYEFLTDVGGTTLAVGSVNLPGTLFGHAFGIRTDTGETATTACVGFGLERLVLALFSQHGFDESRWPRSLREVVFE
jgi:seryl-tRNA synthetase